MIRFLTLIFLLLSNQAFSAGGIKCSDWVSSSGGVASNMGGILGSSIQTAIDTKNGTITEACRDALTSSRSIKGFPTIFTRYKLTRTGDAFSPKYRVTRQTCKFRDCLCNNCECSISKIKFSFSTSGVNMECSNPRDMWASQVISDPENTKEPKSAALCIEKYNTGDRILHFESAKNEGNLPLICSYISFKDISGRCISPNLLNLIGCVEEPQKPGPPIYNPNIVAVANPSVNLFGLNEEIDTASVVSNYLNLGSRFDAPVIQLIINSPKISYTPTLTLQVQFPEYNSGTAFFRYPPMLPAYSVSGPSIPVPLPKNGALFPSYGEFPKAEYSPVVNNNYVFYAKIPSSEPNKVCACLVLTTDGSTTDFCASETYIGCVPRPTLLDSGYATVVDNIPEVYNDEKYPSYFNASKDLVTNNYATAIPTAQITFVKLDSNGVPLIFDRTGDQICKNIKDRKYYKCRDGTINAVYPWSTLDIYYTTSGVTIPPDPATATALANRSKALNENFLSQPPVALIDSTESVILDDKNQVTMLNSIFEHRPIYDSNDTIPIRVRGYEQDVMRVYGVNFSSIIPQMSKFSYQPLKVKILTPDTRQNLDYCNAYSSGFSLSSSYISQLDAANKAETYYVPAGTRWRSACRGKSGCLTGTVINGSGQDCSQSTSDIAGTNVKTGNLFLCDPNPISDNFSKNCCSGPIANNFNFIIPSDDNTCPLVTGKCSAVTSHDDYAESIVCPGVYTTEVSNSFDSANRNSNLYYERPNASDLRILVNSSMISDNPDTSFPPSVTGISFPDTSSLTTGNILINGSYYSLSYPGPIPTVSSDSTSVTRTVLNTIGSNYAAGNLPSSDPASGTSYDIDKSTGVVQAQSICVYTPDDIMSDSGATWSPIGYTLNSPSDGFTDTKGLNAYLCDHIRQICKTITPEDASPLTGYATWPRANSSIEGSNVSIPGTCNIGYSTSNGYGPKAECNDGWIKDATGAMIISNKCLSNCKAKYTQANFITSASNTNYTVTGGPTTFMNDGSTVAVANGAVSGRCNTGYSNNSGGKDVSATCSDGLISPSASELCFADCQAQELPGTKISMPGGDNGVVTFGSCVTGFTPKIVSGSIIYPTAKCLNSNWISAVDTCVPSACPAISAGNAEFISTVNNTTATATACKTGFIPISAPSSTVVMPTMKCTDGVWETVNNPCKAGCSGFTQNGSIFTDSNAGNTVIGKCDSNYFADTPPSAICGSDGKWSNIQATCGNASCIPQTIGNTRFDPGKTVNSGYTILGVCMNGSSHIYVDASYSVDGVNYYYVNSGQKVGVGTYSKTSTSYVPAGISGSVYYSSYGPTIRQATIRQFTYGQCRNGKWVIYEGGCEMPCSITSNSFSKNFTILSGQFLPNVNCNNEYRLEPTMYCSNGSIVQSNPPAIPSGTYFDRCSKQ